MRTVYRNGRVFTGADPEFVDAFVVEDGVFASVGSGAQAPDGHDDDAPNLVDLHGKLVLPGFTDAHTHLMNTGAALTQVPLTDARTLTDIQQRLRDARAADPDAPMLRGRGWLFDSVPDGSPTAAMIDDAVDDVPVFLDANDYHSCWVNSAALDALSIHAETPDPVGGFIERDGNGVATGMLYETAVHLARAFFAASSTQEQQDEHAEAVIDAYLQAGVTGVVDMGFDESALAAFERAAQRHGGQLPVRASAYWFITNTDDDDRNVAQVRRAAQLAASTADGPVRVIGIKLILDGVIDACTAAMIDPYADGSNADPIWPADRLGPVVDAADAAGLHIAMHAIGDSASTMALDAIERSIEVNDPWERRHRLEHLEYAAPGTAARMAELGVIASMQPVHADPAVFANWAAQLGDERVERAFAWPEYEDAGALLAFSTDAPTAPHEALANMYVAATRASALDPSVGATHPQFALPLDRSIVHATYDAAASVGEGDWRGRIAPGYAADFVVVDVDPFVDGPQKLLSARVEQTVVGGDVRFEGTA